MDMTLAAQGLVNLFVNMDGTSRVMFIRLLVTNMKDDEVDLVLQVIDVRQKTLNDESESPDLKVKEELDPKDPNSDNHDNNDSCSESFNNEIDIGEVKNQEIENLKINIEGEKVEKDNFESHLSELDPEIGEFAFSCLFCNRGFISKSNLTRHCRKAHIGQNNLMCDKCPKESLTTDQLKLHNKEHVTNKYQCQYCDESFSLHKDMVIHRKGHPKHQVKINTKFKCEFCQKQFRGRQDLKRHRTVHTGEKEFSCETCGKLFSNQHNLLTHKSSVHDGIQFPCEVCGKQFSNQGNLHIHKQAIHEGVRYLCDKCDYQATRKEHLKIHVEAVHEKKTVTCDQCHKQLSHLSALRNHKLIAHDGVRFPCHLCDYKATKKSYLRIHKEKHHNFPIKILPNKKILNA